jgi:hypothetical protein
MKRQLLIALFVCSATAAGAQTIYRCGSTYSGQPCPGGTTVEAARPSTAAEATAARRETEREARVADAMEQARVREEAKPVPAYIPKEKAEATKQHMPEVFTAKVPGEKKKPAKKKKSDKREKSA